MILLARLGQQLGSTDVNTRLCRSGWVTERATTSASSIALRARCCSYRHGGRGEGSLGSAQHLDNN